MKTSLRKITAGACALLLSAGAMAQTAGTLAVSFTQVAHSPCYSGNRHALAAWIENSAGTYVKTKLRYAGPGGGTSDHLPTFCTAAGGTNNNCMSANTTDATTGATRTSFGTLSFNWNGTNVAGNNVPDGVYTLKIQETWSHGSSTSTRSYTFTKGPNADAQTPANNADFTGVTLTWTPTNTTGVTDATNDNSEISIYPNPNTSGIFNVNFAKANNIKVVNMVGDLLHNENIVGNNTGTKTVDLSNFANGVYFFVINDDEKSTTRKVILNK